MNKEKYIQQELLTYVHSIGSLLLLAGAIVTISLSALDFFVTPENFKTFLIYRLIAASLLIVLHFVFKLRKDRVFQTIILFIGISIPTTMVEL
ncbi:MAG: hypothetical protein AB1390_05395, partial [Nitrospirota bacterium]